MTIFNIVGQDFFKPLTSYLKNLYFDCLEIIYNSYSSELSYGIDREILVSTLADYFESNHTSEINFEDETEILRDSRMKATTFLRKLKDFGWVEYEISNNQTARVVMPDYAVTMFDGLKKFNTSIKKHIEVITADKTSEEIIRDFF